MAVVVYADVVLGLNFLTDLLLLYLSARCVRRDVKLWRVGISAAAGALAALAAFLPGGSFLGSFGAKVLLSALLVGIVVGFAPVRRAAVCYLWFWFFSTALGGGMMFLGLMGASLAESAYFAGAIAVPPWSLPVAGLGLFVLVGLTIGRTRRYLKQEKSLGTLTIGFRGQEAKVPVLIDSGCDLSEPMTGRPVVIAEAAALKGLLPADFKNLLDLSGGDTDKTARSLYESGLSSRFRVIPYRALGSREGLLPAFLPEEVRLDLNGRLLRIEGCVVAVTDLTLAVDGAYRALAPLYIVGNVGKKEGELCEVG